MRRRRKPGSLEKYLEYKDYIIAGETCEEILKEIQDFTQGRELEIELGSGCSGFLIEHASEHPDKTYLAIEYKEELLLKAVRNAEERELKNIRFLRHRIEKLEPVFDQIRAGKLYLNFSDPWPKARHTKRRLTHRNYLELYKKILKDGGIIEFKTDDTPLFEFSLEEFEEAKFDRLELSGDLHGEKEQVIMTEYEKKYLEQGRKIKYVKVSYTK